jgi:hypothetical protein
MARADRPTDCPGIDVLRELERFRTGASSAQRDGRGAGPRCSDIPGRAATRDHGTGQRYGVRIPAAQPGAGPRGVRDHPRRNGCHWKGFGARLPVCVVPDGRDQFEVARRVEMAKCGTRLLPKDLTAPRLRDKVLQAMAMTDGARRVAIGDVATGGAARGADLSGQRLPMMCANTCRGIP